MSVSVYAIKHFNFFYTFYNFVIIQNFNFKNKISYSIFVLFIPWKKTILLLNNFKELPIVYFFHISLNQFYNSNLNHIYVMLYVKKHLLSLQFFKCNYLHQFLSNDKNYSIF